VQEQQLARMEAGGGCFQLPLLGQPAVSFEISFCADIFKSNRTKTV